MNRWITITLAVCWLAIVFPDAGTAEEKKEAQAPSAGERIGTTVREVKEDTTKAYQETKEAVVETSDEVAEDTKKAYQETEEAVKKMIDDVKKGFSGEDRSSRDKAE